MAIGLVPYQWKTDGGMTGWALPDGAVSAIDLRRLSQIADNTATGYAIAVYDGSLPEGAVELDTGDVTRDRDAWFSTLGFRPEGETAIDWAWDQLSEGRGADDSHADHCRPIRCATPEFVEMWLGGRNVRSLSYTDKLRQAVLARKDLDAIFNDVVAGKLPDGVHRKALKAEADRLGIDWRTLRSKSARWRSETPLEPTTTITDEGWSGSTQTLAAYGWTVLDGATGHTWNTGADTIIFGNTGNSENSVAYHPTTLSSSDNYASALTANLENSCGSVCRGGGTTSTNWSAYGVKNGGGAGGCTLYSFVNAVATQLGYASAAGSSSPYTRRVQAIGSAIKGSDNNTAWRLEVTNTAVSTGLRVGLWGTHGGYGNTAFSIFTGGDFVAPTVTNNSASATFGVGGTVQMSATESPTSWSLQGSPPTGVSINSSGLVTWTSATPTGVHSITVRATNATGSGDGTLTLTITEATTTSTFHTLFPILINQIPFVILFIKSKITIFDFIKNILPFILMLTISTTIFLVFYNTTTK